ncbi:MAG TPA: hypothetical protein VFW11_17560, partial [Cyclobacteriaceae bacterium]|nr:hypothetical protein [Cyclobacteriaceae bacterium]
SSGYSLVEYQTLLLQQLISNNAHGLVHNFNLSFIKKRITMMKNKQSGWPGKAKVATAIAASAFIGAILVQCNSRLDESLPSNAKTTIDDFSNGVNLPVLPSTGYAFKGDATDVLNFTVAENKLTVDGNPLEVADIVSLIEKGGVPSLQGFVVMRIDKDQTMGLVRSIDWELRKADRLKILYVGQTSDGTKVETSLLLPPTPENAAMNGMPLQPDISDVEAEGKTDILKIDIGDHTADVSQQKVYDFVQRHIAKKSSDYVVSFRYTDTDTYGDYLVNLVHIKEGFNQIYQERSQKTFGKDYYSLDKGEFKQVREGIPMAMSIAEKREL